MTTQTSDALAKAIAYLGAVEVTPERYAIPHGDASVQQWLIVPAYIMPFIDSAYLEQRAIGGILEETAIPMPSWWTPESRFAWRIVEQDGTPWKYDKVIERFLEKADALTVALAENGLRQRLVQKPVHAERITADLETGKEVPA